MRSLILTDRDRSLLAGIRDHSFMPADVAERHIFNTTNRRGFNRRIEQLAEAGLLSFGSVMGLSRRRIIKLTRKGFQIASSGYPLQITPSSTTEFRTFDHDSYVIAARYRLQELWKGEWIPEVLLKRDNLPRIPDGVLKFSTGTLVAIELENSPKGPKRFQEIMQTWAESDFGLVLYVASNEGLFETVKGYLESGPKDDIFGLVALPSLHSPKPHVWTQRGIRDLFARTTL